jgi:hypothetical protein
VKIDLGQWAYVATIFHKGSVRVEVRIMVVVWSGIFCKTKEGSSITQKHRNYHLPFFLWVVKLLGTSVL